MNAETERQRAAKKAQEEATRAAEKAAEEQRRIVEQSTDGMVRYTGDAFADMLEDTSPGWRGVWGEEIAGVWLRPLAILLVKQPKHPQPSTERLKESVP